MVSMSEFDENDQQQDDNTDDGSDLVKNLRKQLAEQSKKIKSFEEAQAATERAARQESLKRIVKDFGVPETAAKRIPEDVAADESAVKEWLADFGFKPAEKQQEVENLPTQTVGDDDGTDEDAAVAQALTRAQGTEGSGQVPAQLGGDKILADLGKLEGRGIDAIEAYFRTGKLPV